jgi:PiT family inorganic phosphate transporter
MVGWILTLPAAGGVGALAALVVTWLGFWGIIIDSALAAAVILAIFVRSRRNEVTASNAMSEVAESGRAVKVKRNPPPTRRQRAIAREEARRQAAVAAAAKRAAKADKAARAGKGAPAGGPAAPGVTEKPTKPSPSRSTDGGAR